MAAYNTFDKLPTAGAKPEQEVDSEASSVIKPDVERDASPQPPKPAGGPPGGPFPEGGRKAWLAVAGSAACLFCSFGWINCVGIFEEYYTTNQLKGYSSSEVAWIPGLQVFFMLFAGVLVGKVYDDFGPAALLIPGTFLHVFGLMMTSLSKTYAEIILSQSICSGIGAAMIFYPAINTVSTWFLKKRGAALGPVAAGASVGGIVFPIMVTNLLPKVGFGWTMRICAFLILAVLIFANLTVRSRLPPNKRPYNIMNFIRPLQERNFAVLTASVFFFYWGMFIPIIYIVSVARQRGLSFSMSNYLVTIMNATSLIGRTVPNFVADKVGHFNVMITMASLTTVLIFALFLPSDGEPLLIAFAALFGITSGAGVGLVPALIAKISPIQEIGLRTGSTLGIAACATLTGSPIGGALAARAGGDFKYTIVFGGVCCAIGSILYVFARASVVGFKPSKF